MTEDDEYEARARDLAQQIMNQLTGQQIGTVARIVSIMLANIAQVRGGARAPDAAVDICNMAMARIKPDAMPLSPEDLSPERTIN